MKFDWMRSWTQPVFICLIVLYSIDDVSPSSPPQRICRPKLVGFKGKGERKVSETTVYGVPGKPFEIECEWKRPRKRRGRKGKKKRRANCRTTPLLFFYNDQLINETNSDITIERTHWVSKLIIQNFTKLNVGVYKCRINVGSSRGRKQLTYDARYSDCKPTTTSYPMNLEIKRYITAEVNCWLDGGGALPSECGTHSVEFFREGIPVEASRKKYKVVGQTLQIFYFDPSDVGNYSCVYQNRYGKVRRNFSLVVVEPWESTKTIKHALLPYKPDRVNETQIYFLPRMTKDTGTKSFVRAQKYVLKAYFYVGKDMTMMRDWEVEWYFRNDSFFRETFVKIGYSRRLNHTDPEFRVHSLTYEEECPFDISDKICYRSELHFKTMESGDVGTYTVRLYSNKYPSDARTFSWRVLYDLYEESPRNKINVHVDFEVLNASVCLGQNYNLTCHLQPREEVAGLIMRLGENYNLMKNYFGNDPVVLVQYPTDETNSYPSRESQHLNPLIGTFRYEMKNLTLNDTGAFICAACGREQSCGEASYSVMTLTVVECSADSVIKESIFSNKYVIVIFVVCTVTAVIIGIASCAVHIKARRAASDRSVMKRVVISRPNANYGSANRNHTRHRSSSANSSCGRDSNMSENSSSPLIPPRVRIHNRFVPFRRTPRALDSALTYDHPTCSDSDSAYYPSPRGEHILYEFPVDPSWEFPRSQLRIGDLLGSGAFGTVWRGEARDLHDRPGVTVVAVKMLNYGFDDSDLTDFVKEMEIMKIMDPHPHLIRLLATCTQNGPPMVLTEFAEHGNLKNFLQKWRRQGAWIQQNPSNLDISKPDYCIRKRDLLTFAQQIAIGMDYLSSKSIVHRDLAARNVLVGENYCMKIADFGMTRTVYNYYKKTTDGRLPIKWLAPESLELKKFTTKSDIWSFGILMWEIFSLGGTPYPSIPVERLYLLLRQGYRNEQPELADKEVYGIMMRCWEDNPLRRPWFTDLVLELTRRLELTPLEEGIDYCVMMHPSTSTGQSETSPSTDYSDYPMV